MRFYDSFAVQMQYVDMPKNIPQNVLKAEKGNTSDQELLQDAHRDMPATFLASCF